ncbi:MAG: cupin domain-containing protein [Gammaproteobacteria bacterium]|nr:cupin domain-containing protein [Gammaproteobacteria bacterium]
MPKTRYQQVTTYQTRDGSQIRELLHPDQHGNRNQSLAEATVAAGEQTVLHRHHRSEEIYHILEGEGWMTLGDQCFAVAAGDTVAILPGEAHRIHNTGKSSLRFLCSCAPAYAHEDTELLETPES